MHSLRTSVCAHRRRDLEYSFTGESSRPSMSSGIETLREEYGLGSDAFLTCVPSHPADEPIPHYRYLVEGVGRAPASRAIS